jgi:hypothetical protein
MSMASGSWRFDRQPSRQSSEDPAFQALHTDASLDFAVNCRAESSGGASRVVA